MTPPPAPTASPDLAVRIGRVLRARGFREATLAGMAGFAGPALDVTLVEARSRLAASTRDVRGDGDDAGALATLVRLFMLRIAVPVDEAALAVAPTTVDEWQSCNLLRVEDGRVLAVAGLRPFRQLALAHDPMPQPGDLFAGIVLGVSGSTATLAALTVRRPVRRALDVGCGNGVHALLAALHAESVVAVDVNPRALAYTRFNAALNGIGNVEVREGDLFAPVAGERFDLVVANPPVAVSPHRDLTFRDAGLRGDEMSGVVMRGAAEHLGVGGLAHVTCHWTSAPADDDGDAHMRSWALQTGCDVYALRLTHYTPEAYAREWVQPTVPAPQRDAAERAWVDHLRGLDAAVIHAGIAILHRSGAAPSQVVVDRSVTSAHDDAGDDVLRGFAMRRRLAALPNPDAFLDMRLQPAPGVVLEAVQNSDAVLLRTTRGLGRLLRLDAPTAAVVARCDGRRPLRSLVEATGATRSTPLLRWLAEHGVLLPTG